MRASRGPWVTEARRQLPAMRTWRAALHQEPELANEEVRTQSKLVTALEGLGIRAETYPRFTGVRAVIGADRPGVVVALRADMDALPVTEQTGLPFGSRSPGRMHACGHDVHMACLLGAAAVLKRKEATLRGPTVLLFQPAEEEGTRGGALPFLEHGAFTRPKVDFVLGQHVAPEIPLGHIGWKKGAMMAAADHLIIRVRGRAGHAAYPHAGPDAVLTAAEVITGLQAIVSRIRDPVDPVVISVGMVHGGTRHNVLPEEVVLEGTIRTFRPETRAQMERVLRRRVRHIALSNGASARVTIRPGYPVTFNPPATTEVIVQALAEEFGEQAVEEIERPVMGAEDFSRYLERVPGTFLFLGVGEGAVPASLHSPTFAPTDSALVPGCAALLAATAGLQRS
ncbi:MAG: M20 family metallopeptidase [Thermoplasmata archaeon]|nr:M20 family metallopeptidase [Thermoplasmata archaeon]